MGRRGASGRMRSGPGIKAKRYSVGSRAVLLSIEQMHAPQRTDHSSVQELRLDLRNIRVQGRLPDLE